MGLCSFFLLQHLLGATSVAHRHPIQRLVKTSDAMYLRNALVHFIVLEKLDLISNEEKLLHFEPLKRDPIRRFKTFWTCLCWPRLCQLAKLLEMAMGGGRGRERERERVSVCLCAACWMMFF